MSEQISELFATKAIEYLLVIGFLLAFILFWRTLNRPVPRPSALFWTPRSWFQVADDAYYHPAHVWVKPEPGGLARVGIDDFAQKLLGPLGAVDLPPVGKPVSRGAAGCRLGVNSASVEVLAPIDGQVVQRNEALLKDPDLVNRDPYGKGWLFRVRPKALGRELTQLLHGREARAWMAETEVTLDSIMMDHAGMVLPDGGVVASGIARNIEPEAWEALAARFLNPEPEGEPSDPKSP